MRANAIVSETQEQTPANITQDEGQKMRIACPKCEAQYDVDPAMIPEAGRDVQCSNCGFTWLQGPQSETANKEAIEPPAEAPTGSEDMGEPDADDKLRAAIEQPRTEKPQPESDPEAFAADIREAISTGEADEVEAGGVLDPEDEGEAPTGIPPISQPPELDEEAAGILREEAEREVSQRREEDAPPIVEPQGDLDLDEEARPSEILRERLERMRSDGVPKSTVAATLTAAKGAELTAPRKERLPDIEEISSSLRPDQAKGGEKAIPTPELNRIRQSGFRRGFSIMVLAAAAAVAAYVFAPQIIGMIPASEPAMLAYVDTANGVRDQIDQVMGRAIAVLDGLGAGDEGA